MGETYDLVLRGGTVVNQDGVRDVAVRDGQIAAIGDLGAAAAGDTVECRGLTVLPGVIDSHVHFREPGLIHKEDLESGSRDAVHRAGLWQGVASGIVDTLGSDHSPHTLDEKAHPYPKSHSGMTGVQTLVPVMLDHVAAGRLSIERFVDLTSAGPARVFGIARKGRVAVGYDADLTVVDLARRETITSAWIASKSAWTPYDGLKVRGWPIGTFVRGHKVTWDGDLVSPARGEPVCFAETLPLRS